MTRDESLAIKKGDRVTWPSKNRQGEVWFARADAVVIDWDEDAEHEDVERFSYTRDKLIMVGIEVVP